VKASLFVDKQDCQFCSLSKDRIRQASEFAFAFLDGFPVNHGHTLVVPKHHVASVFDLPEKEQAAVWNLVAHVRAMLLAELKPDGFNVGLSDGTAAGQTVMHAHVHIIPRHKGDVANASGGIRWIVPAKAAYWTGGHE